MVERWAYDILVHYLQAVYQIRHIPFYTDESPGIFSGLFVFLCICLEKRGKKRGFLGKENANYNRAGGFGDLRRSANHCSGHESRYSQTVIHVLRSDDNAWARTVFRP